ncbi:DNA helicase [Tanacetum coccineum]
MDNIQSVYSSSEHAVVTARDIRTSKTTCPKLLIVAFRHWRRYAEFINPTTVLDIQRQPCRTDEEEKNKKQRVKFTREATIMEINASKGWYYRKCTACNKKVPGGSFEPHCPDHGPQPMANYGAIINGGTSVATITCFSSKAHTFLLDCNDVVNVADNKDNRDVPVGL